MLQKELELEVTFRRLGKRVPEWEDLDYESDSDYDFALCYKPQYPRRYGVSSVAHSLLEDGRFVRPILDLCNSLDLERRDPQGRTMFLAACRSTLGLDASIDAIYKNLDMDPATHALRENPYPHPDNPWRHSVCQGQTAVCSGPTFLEFFISRGANLFAMDNYGRNALHQLFTSFDHDTVPAIFDVSLRYLLSNCSALISQADHAGIYPLHLAIRRMGRYWVGAHGITTPMAVYHLEKDVDNLLAAGADPQARDWRGNTVLHYLAAYRLGKNDRMGDQQRRLLREFLHRGVDATARNCAGASALELCLSTADPPDVRDSEDLERYAEIGREIVDEFERAGCSLSETNPAGQTLLHLVAALDSPRAFPWFKLLQTRSLDPLATDKEGVTPMDLAKQNMALVMHYSAFESSF